MRPEALPAGSLPPVVYVTRKFPPRIGGMENLAERLAGLLSAHASTEVVAWDGSQASLPTFLGRVVKVAWRATRPGNLPVLLVGDVALAAALPLLARPGKGRRVVVAHGLDVVWTPGWYQRSVRRVLPRFDAVLAISQATRAACVARGVPDARCLALNPPVEVPVVVRDRGRLADTWGADLAERRLVLSLGRLVPRKGLAWFVTHVVPLLPEDVRILVGGDGPEAEGLSHLVTAQGLTRRVRLLGPVSPAERSLLYGTADAFVLPNVAVPGDMEGFGLAATEAALAGLPVVASDLEGLRDAVPPGPGRWRVAPGDAQAFAAALGEALAWNSAQRAVDPPSLAARDAREALSQAWLDALFGS